MNNIALVAMSHSPSLLINHLEAYLIRLELWLWDWRIAINNSNSTIVFFIKTMRCIQKPRQVQFLGQPIQWVETAYLVSTCQPSEKEGSSKIWHA
jgi:hypothetical protein